MLDDIWRKSSRSALAVSWKRLRGHHARLTIAPKTGKRPPHTLNRSQFPLKQVFRDNLTTCSLSCAVNSIFSSWRVYGKSAASPPGTADSSRGNMSRTNTSTIYLLLWIRSCSSHSIHPIMPNSVFDFFVIFLLFTAFYAFSLTTPQPQWLFWWSAEHQSCSTALNSNLKKYLTTLSNRSCKSPSRRHACLLSFEAVPTEINLYQSHFLLA